jgi:hypothetical protein
MIGLATIDRIDDSSSPAADGGCPLHLANPVWAPAVGELENRPTIDPVAFGREEISLGRELAASIGEGCAIAAAFVLLAPVVVAVVFAFQVAAHGGGR